MSAQPVFESISSNPLYVHRRYLVWHRAIREFPESDAVADKQKLGLKCGVAGVLLLLHS